MAMEVQVIWECSETYKPEPNLKLKEFLKESTTSISNQLVEQDYSLKFNNNSLSKILMNNQIKDLVNKFHGGRIDILPTSQSLEEMESLKNNIIEKESRLTSLKQEISKLEETHLKSINFEILKNKMENLIKPLSEDNTYYIKVKDKIIKNLTIYDTMFKETGEMKVNFIKLKISENIGYYNKIINHCLKELLKFVYKFGVLFLNHKSYLEKFSSTYTMVFKKFLKSLNHNIRTCPTFEKFLVERKEDYENFLSQLEENIYEYRITKYVYGEPPSTVFFSFDEPVKVNISEMEFREIKELLTQFPTIQNLRNIYPLLSDQEFTDKVFFLVLERDLQIYQNYGIQMEDFINGILLYEN
jgi:hypothetical protein